MAYESGQPEPLFRNRDRFCTGCHYNLRGVTHPECPECGLPFDPTNYRTFLEDPPPRVRLPATLRSRAQLLGVLAVVLVLLYLPWIALHFGLEIAFEVCCGVVMFSPLLFGAAVYLILDLLPDAVAENLFWTLPLGLVVGAVLGLPYFPFGVVIGAFTGPVGALLHTSQRLSP